MKHWVGQGDGREENRFLMVPEHPDHCEVTIRPLLDRQTDRQNWNNCAWWFSKCSLPSLDLLD